MYSAFPRRNSGSGHQLAKHSRAALKFIFFHIANLTFGKAIKEHLIKFVASFPLGGGAHRSRLTHVVPTTCIFTDSKVHHDDAPCRRLRGLSAWSYVAARPRAPPMF